MKLHLNVEGLDTLNVQVERTIVNVRREAKKFCLEEARQIMEESIFEVPVETGALRDSSYIEQDSEGDVEFGYGAGDRVNPRTKQSPQEYMMAVHERLDTYHPVGKAKFLEDPVNRHKITIEEKVARRLNRVLL
jgi:hypothetical protein